MRVGKAAWSAGMGGENYVKFFTEGMNWKLNDKSSCLGSPFSSVKVIACIVW